jgi:enoyl-CoA hydratase
MAENGDRLLRRATSQRLFRPMVEGDIWVREEGVLGRLTLNRPRALNALTLPMCAAILDRLEAWRDDTGIEAVLIDAVPGRAFCAGGDIRAIYEWGKAGDPRAVEFFDVEYRMNAAIARFPKPYVALLDGIVMGGGAGVSIHGGYRVASENTVFAMPETAIGFFPDIGASFFLPRCPGEMGMYLGLTGTRMGPADMRYTGLATHYVSSARLTEIAPRLAAGEGVDTVLDSLADNCETAPLHAHREALDRVFSASDVKEMQTRLTAEGEWGSEISGLLAARSPTSLKLTHRLLRIGASLDLTGCLALELRLVRKILQGSEFYEGVRAAVIDKDQAPQWNPPTLEAVTDADIDRFFNL